jgi:hypothetical protein
MTMIRTALLLLACSGCAAPRWVPDNPIDAALIASETGLTLYSDVQADLATGKDAATIYAARERQGLIAVGMAELAEQAALRGGLTREGQDAYQASMMTRHYVTELMGNLRSGALAGQQGQFTLKVAGDYLKGTVGKLQFLNVRSQELREKLKADMEAEARRRKGQ